MRCFSVKKKVEEVRLEGIRKNKGLYWIDCPEASIRELKLLANKFDISLSCLKHSLDKFESARFEQRDKYYYIIFNAPMKNTHGVGTVPIGIFFTKNVVITISSDKVNAIEDIYHNEDLKNVLIGDVLAIVGRFLLAMIRDYNTFLNEVGDLVDDLEEKVFKQYNVDFSKKIFGIRKILMYFSKAFSDNMKVIEIIKSKELSEKKNNLLYNDVYIEAKQLIDEVEIYRNRITSIMEIYLGNASNRLNEVMKGFTVIASLLLFPTVIGGIYGMNLLLPLAEHRNAFWIVIGIMLGGMAIMYTYFKKKEWV
jgi:magnesium transporter